jgi:phage N-6-adenine-methyltransferase
MIEPDFLELDFPLTLELLQGIGTLMENGKSPFDEQFIDRAGFASWHYPQEIQQATRILGVLATAFLKLPEKDQRKILQNKRIAPRRGKLDVHFMSEKQDHETPEEFFRILDDEFHFTIDACATAATAKCPRFVSPEMDFFQYVFVQEVAWMNPEYGTMIGKFMQRAFEQSQDGSTFVCLVPSRTDTEWWHSWALKADEVRQVKGRIPFMKGSGAPFPSSVVIFRPGIKPPDHTPKFSTMVWKAEKGRK